MTKVKRAACNLREILYGDWLEDFSRDSDDRDFKTFSMSRTNRLLAHSIERFLKMVSEDPLSKPLFEKAVSEEGESLSDYGLFKRVVFEGFKLKAAYWNPADPLSKLKASLKEFGPHVVEGHFILSEKRLSADGFYESVFLESGSHAITVIGADRSSIYYLNPLDESDPTGSERPIYRISYEEFTRRIYDQAGDPFDKDHISSAGYAIHTCPH